MQPCCVHSQLMIFDIRRHIQYRPTTATPVAVGPGRALTFH